MSGRTQHNHGVLIRGRQEDHVRKRYDDGIEVGVMPFEDGGRLCEPRNAGGIQKVEKAETALPPEPLKGAQPCPHLDFQSLKCILDS